MAIAPGTIGAGTVGNMLGAAGNMIKGGIENGWEGAGMGFGTSLAGAGVGSGLGAAGSALTGGAGEVAGSATGKALTGMTGDLAAGTADITPSALTAGTSTGAQTGTAVGDVLGLPAEFSAGIGSEASVQPSLSVAQQVAAAGGTPEAAATQATLESAPAAANAVADAAGMNGIPSVMAGVDAGSLGSGFNNVMWPGAGDYVTGAASGPSMGGAIPGATAPGAGPGMMDSLGKVMGSLNTGAKLAQTGMGIARAANPPDPAPTFIPPPPRMRPMVGSLVPTRRPMAPPPMRPFTPLRRY